jgi:NAD(P)-dependent dehydrogenase (short-subunit alcohol dehydrogenase family)
MTTEAIPTHDARPVALVTGSTSGIGEGIARRLASDGFRVVVHSRSSAERGRELAAELDGHYQQADLGDEDQAVGLVEACVAKLGRLDVLVNNAGISRVIAHDDLAAATPAIWRELLEVNLIAPWVLTSAAVPHLQASARSGGVGAIVNITSHAGIRPKGASIPYAASKAALGHVTKLLAASLGPHIRVNAIAPGLVDTKLSASWTAVQDHWRQNSPMQRAAQPTDVADLTSALLSNRYITGEVIILDGGMNLR